MRVLISLVRVRKRVSSTGVKTALHAVTRDDEK